MFIIIDTYTSDNESDQEDLKKGNILSEKDIPENYSKELRKIIASMLNCNWAKRPTARTLIEKKLIQNYLRNPYLIVGANKRRKLYYGETYNGMNHGIGILLKTLGILYEKGSKYEGEWRNNKKNGKGKLE